MKNNFLRDLFAKKLYLKYSSNLLEHFFNFLDYELVINRRGGQNLWHCGYVYRKKTQFANSTNWICMNNKCPARVITTDKMIKYGKRKHNHPPKVEEK